MDSAYSQNISPTEETTFIPTRASIPEQNSDNTVFARLDFRYYLLLGDFAVMCQCLLSFHRLLTPSVDNSSTPLKCQPISGQDNCTTFKSIQDNHAVIDSLCRQQIQHQYVNAGVEYPRQCFCFEKRRNISTCFKVSLKKKTGENLRF